jgi:hypothetical protein
MAKLFNQETSIELYLRKKEPKRFDEKEDDFFSWFICDLRISSSDFIEYNFNEDEIILCAGEMKQLIHGIRDIIEKGKYITKERLFDFNQPLLRFDFISYEASFELSFIDNGICDDIPSVVVEFWLNPSTVISDQYETKRGLSFIVNLAIIEKFADDLASEMLTLSTYEFGFCHSEPKAKNLFSSNSGDASVPSLCSGLRAYPELAEGMTKK